MLLKGKNAIVTGANRGIGKTIVQVFAEHGANVWACARRETEAFTAMCGKISKEYRVFVRPVYFEMTNDDEVKASIKKIKAEKCMVDILVNNAGIVPENRLFPMADFSEMHRIFDVNFFAAMRLTQMIAKIMIRQKQGIIVNMASIAALDGEPAQVEYVASKAALIGATKKLASELGTFGIRVNAVAPGVTETDMIKSMNSELLARMAEQTIMRRLANPTEIANGVLFLASSLSSYMTGQVIRIDGGLRR